MSTQVDIDPRHSHSVHRSGIFHVASGGIPQGSDIHEDIFFPIICAVSKDHIRHSGVWSLELSGTVLNFHELQMTATQSLYHKRTPLICGSYSSNALLHCISFLKLKMVFAKLYPQYFTQVAHPQKCRIFENIRGTDLHLIWLTCSTSVSLCSAVKEEQTCN